MIKQFLYHPGQEYHVRGLVRILDEEINAVRRELQNLESATLLKSQRRGNRLFYNVNPYCTILPELSNMMYKDRDDIKKITTALSKINRIMAAVLTENYLQAKYETPIDIDILLVGEIDIQRASGEVKILEKALGKELRITILKPTDIEFQHKKRDPFLLNILRSNKIMLIGSEKELI